MVLELVLAWMLATVPVGLLAGRWLRHVTPPEAAAGDRASRATRLAPGRLPMKTFGVG